MQGPGASAASRRSVPAAGDVQAGDVVVVMAVATLFCGGDFVRLRVSLGCFVLSPGAACLPMFVQGGFSRGLA